MKILRFCLVQAVAAAVIFAVSMLHVSASGLAGRDTALPNGYNLLRLAVQAQNHFGVVHAVGFSKLLTRVHTKHGWVNVDDQGWFVGDGTTSAPGDSRVVMRTVNFVGEKKSKIYGFTYVTVGKSLATLAYHARKWRCQSYSLLKKFPQYTPANFSSTMPKAPKGGKMWVRTLRGAEFKGKPVWLVAFTTWGKNGSKSVDVSYIDKQTFAVYESTALVTVKSHGVTVVDFASLAMSKFGEKMSFHFPADC
ncbi:MAG TPA: hypothetical protein VG815_18655 [Chloroflexota bacterium]|jgi:hypothetical protein|nr:hypothetical protein [Chloroflexota bacterium]